MAHRHASFLSVTTLALAGCVGRGASSGPATSAAVTPATPGRAGRAGGESSGLPIPPGGGVPRPSGQPGGLTVLDWAGFRAAVSYTFDDTNSSQIMNYAALNALGVPMTFYLITNKKEFNDPVWLQAIKDGHEIGSHTRSHLRPGTAADVDAGDTDLRSKLGITVYTMAAPFGDGSYTPLAQTRYLFNRGVADGLIAPQDDTNPFFLPCYVPPENAPASTMNENIDTLHGAGRWKTVLVHGFVGGTDGAYKPVALGEFIAHVNHVKQLGDVWIDSVVNVGAYWMAQKMFAGITPAASGNSKTWTWTLPPHFPPGRVLRVRVDGGTLTQPGGKTLAWDDRGYYEVALDAGSLTLSP
jgi:peptidoglycan/xylan/chitin deacetylase (PgdA/CDA1 family)